MRAIGSMIGLLGLLITVAIIVWVWADYNKPVADVGTKAEEQVQQIAGIDPQSGQHIESTYDLKTETRADGKLQDFLVARVDQGSPLDVYFGLKVGDQITAAVDSHGIRNDFYGADDPEMAKYQVRDTATTGAASGNGQLFVKRGDATLTLPQDKNSAAALATPAAHPTTQPNQPAAQQNPAQQNAAPQQPKNNQQQPPADPNDPMQQLKDRGLLRSVPGM
jgi:hypothetical protein